MTVWMIEMWQGPVTGEWRPTTFRRTREEARTTCAGFRFMWPNGRYRVRLYRQED